jgi:hypothetical protein
MKSSTSGVYVAIPVELVETLATSSLPQLGTAVRSTDKTDVPNSECPASSPDPDASGYFQLGHHQWQIPFFFVGSVWGMFFSVLGFYVQQSCRFRSILAYSLSWSCLTSLASFGLFYGTGWVLDRVTSLPYEHYENARTLEYSFAVGVFSGFCTACTITDVVLGMPLRNILVTVAVAVVWAAVMVYCGASATGGDEDDYDDDDEVVQVVLPESLRERTSSRFPVVIV